MTEERVRTKSACGTLARAVERLTPPLEEGIQAIVLVEVP
jgi:hypothetical protein